MNDYVSITLGMLCAGAGGELLLRGALGMAAWLRIPPLLTRGMVSVFVYAAAEIAIVIEASRILRPDLALGAALGATVVHLGLVLAIAYLNAPHDVRPVPGMQIIIVAAIAPLVTLFVARNSGVSRLEGSGLLVFFGLWIVASLWEAAKHAPPAEDKPDETVAEGRGWLAIAFTFVGLLLLASTGRLIVHGVEGLAQTFSLSYFTLGATLVPLCITVPELTSAFALKYRAGGAISTNKLMANSILNAWFLAGLAAVIAPFRVEPSEVAPVALTAAVLPLAAWPSARVPHLLRGVILIGAYAGLLYYCL